MSEEMTKPITVERRVLLHTSLASFIGLMAEHIQAKPVYSQRKDGEEDNDDRVCISQKELRRLALSAGDIVRDQSQELLTALELAEGNRELFSRRRVQRMLSQEVISKADAEVLDEIITILFHSESLPEVRQQVLEIFKKLQKSPHASPVVLAVASAEQAITDMPEVLALTFEDVEVIATNTLEGASVWALGGFATGGGGGALFGAIIGAIVGFVVGLSDVGLDHGIGHFTSMSLQKTQRLDIAKG